MTQINPIAQLNEMLQRRDFGAVLALTDTLLRKSQNNASAWHARARAAFGVGRLGLADECIDRSIALGEKAHDVLLLRAIIHHRLARSDLAIAGLRALMASNAPNIVDATLALAEVLHRADRRDELQALVTNGGAWLLDERADIFTARVTAKTDPQGTADRLELLARGGGQAIMRRIAGFDAVRMLDAAGHYRRAFDLATHLHATTSESFDIDGLIADTRQQHALLARAKPWFLPRAPAVNGVALVVGMPRSGTTLLEQMLDRHPDISGIGEYDGVTNIGNAVQSAGAWPGGLGILDTAAAKQMQNDYLQGARARQRANTRWTFDKSLHVWKWLPAVAAVLPGAMCFHIVRDPRDCAISLLLSNFHPKSFGWTSSLHDIQRVMTAERALAPLALATLGMPHETIVYENLVDDPRAHMQRATERLGVAMQDSVLAPQSNTRTVLTLSHEQVRKPINKSSIGRWKNYEFAFDDSWRALAGAHDARRTQ